MSDARSLSLCTLAWPNINPVILAAHESTMKHHGLSVNYTKAIVEHGAWVECCIRECTTDVVGVIDVDCVPFTADIVYECARYAYNTRSFVGVAQVANHMGPATAKMIYAAPSFLFLHAKTYVEHMANGLSLRASENKDAACGITTHAEDACQRHRLIFPTRYERGQQTCDGPAWPLHNYGQYGIGTVYDDQIYHLFCARHNSHADLFKTRCEQIVAGDFSFMEGMLRCQELIS